MLNVRGLVRSDTGVVADVHCCHGSSGWSAPEHARSHALVLTRRGTFRRLVDGRLQILEPNVAYFQRAGDEQQVAHPLGGGDRCTSIALGPGFAAIEPPANAFRTSPDLDLRARHVLTSAARGAYPDDLEEAVVLLVHDALAAAHGDDHRHDVRPSRGRLVSQAREALAVDANVGLVTLAEQLQCSPAHLGRAFRQSTGVSLTAYRRRLRVRLALERIAGGEAGLARVAAEAGFSDHAHMTRSIRAEFGTTPTRLRHLLA